MKFDEIHEINNYFGMGGDVGGGMEGDSMRVGGRVGVMV